MLRTTRRQRERFPLIDKEPRMLWATLLVAVLLSTNSQGDFLGVVLVKDQVFSRLTHTELMHSILSIV